MKLGSLFFSCLLCLIIFLILPFFSMYSTTAVAKERGFTSEDAKNSSRKENDKKKKRSKTAADQEKLEGLVRPDSEEINAAEYVVLTDATVQNFYTAEQIQLNQAATEAVMAGDNQEAIRLFKEILKRGAFNVTWLNLGRTYAKSGQCLEAYEAYRSVPTSTKLYGIDEKEIEEKLSRFQEELYAECQVAFKMESDRLIEKGKPIELAGWTVFGVGAASVITSIVLYSVNSTNIPEGLKPATLIIGTLALITGGSLLFAKFDISNRAKRLQATLSPMKDSKPLEIHENSSEDLDALVGESEVSWSPNIFSSPKFYGLGATIYY